MWLAGVCAAGIATAEQHQCLIYHPDQNTRWMAKWSSTIGGTNSSDTQQTNLSLTLFEVFFIQRILALSFTNFILHCRIIYFLECWTPWLHSSGLNHVGASHPLGWGSQIWYPAMLATNAFFDLVLSWWFVLFYTNMVGGCLRALHRGGSDWNHLKLWSTMLYLSILM